MCLQERTGARELRIVDAAEPLLRDDRAVAPRRVVTGQLADGKSVFVADDALEPISVALMPGTQFDQIWGSDEPVVLPSNGVAPPATRFFPPVEGFRFLVWTIGPAGATIPDDVDIPAAVAEVETNLPGLIDHTPASPRCCCVKASTSVSRARNNRISFDLIEYAPVAGSAPDQLPENGRGYTTDASENNSRPVPVSRREAGRLAIMRCRLSRRGFGTRLG